MRTQKANHSLNASALILLQSWLAALTLLLLLVAPAGLLSPRVKASQTSADNQSPQRPKRVADQEPTISLESNLVDLVFTVTDANNRLVTDLTAESVILLEDGIAQTIRFFGRNNEAPMVLALVVDFSGSQEFNWPKEREAAEKFFSEVFRWNKDYAALLCFRGTVELYQGLTDDQNHLTNALQSLVRTDEGYASQGSSVFDAVFVTVDEVLDGPTARRILQRNDHRIRRAMILISDGRDTSSINRIEQAIERAQRANVLVFAIGISDSFRFADVDSKVLDRLSSETGGRAYYPANDDDLRAAFKQIADELSSQYIVGYYPTNMAKDGSFRKVAVKVVGKDGLKVAHRAGYFAAKDR